MMQSVRITVGRASRAKARPGSRTRSTASAGSRATPRPALTSAACEVVLEAS
ncbi:Uncharacterised protein [Bordetella pertussis]|nr:Uncharacterised protein [Bordetella pertussis]CFN66317.1 Uncharacterised protein [Bordetella pertussis]CFT80546.1 Uncharacterised protein [Bordetella pertussis]CFU45087.1 Uncharacterised protein [Bordetella pertussis]CFW48551.1 Uncharacterised protein [Bordetella pertussis]